ncbi:MAG: type II toxin-antitoxin system PemK/MazF family toxin [candidate division KSB1 bacterium]|nr:type II toxin-antitoxin system PemK/MazF family toxin [candidate division KSB1 bacterium]MDZ7303555.1 type II toxin-antitoxin system PemK/MazF family toxin [candidate division KSB1 bacterium]MDZ7312798.1 type II toxin-antitoxin system PemK/MazF family toxin [candidate division KSB1 bacterium]
MTRGKVVLVPFPFDDLSTTKARPALCLTDPIGPHRHVVVAFISSQIPVDLMETGFVLDSMQADFWNTGLRVSSVLRLHRLMTVTTSLISRELGSISSDTQTQVDEKLRRLFKLAQQ